MGFEIGGLLRIFSILSICAFFNPPSVYAQELELTPKTKKILCARMQKVIPTETGKVLSISECLEKGSFAVTEDTKDRYILQWVGQTVEDVATVCVVEWAKVKADVKKLRSAGCVLE